MDTIFALASGSWRAGVAVIRISGEKALLTLEHLTQQTPPPRQATLCFLKDGNLRIDQALVTYFKSPASFTGEDVVEYHVHGGRAVITALLNALGKISGCRLAEPGEFTRRAFENGKFDLTEAEAIADLIDAETEAQRLQALDQLEGKLSALYQGWMETLKKALAHQEADIEFPEEDLPTGISPAVTDTIRGVLSDIQQHLNDGRRGERLRDGIRVAIIGAPNAGKSSLLNALAARDVAIVSPEAGTTRDIIEVHLNLGGYPVILTDTAGLRETQHAIEAEGIRRARQAADNSDLKILLLDMMNHGAALPSHDEKTILVFNKTDLADNSLLQKKHPEYFFVSAKTERGLPQLIAELTNRVANMFSKKTGPCLTRERHREALTECALSLQRSLSAALPELAAEDMRLAVRSLGKITGRVHIEDLLDTIFHDFCIGK